MISQNLFAMLSNTPDVFNGKRQLKNPERLPGESKWLTGDEINKMLRQILDPKETYIFDANLSSAAKILNQDKVVAKEGCKLFLKQIFDMKAASYEDLTWQEVVYDKNCPLKTPIVAVTNTKETEGAHWVALVILPEENDWLTLLFVDSYYKNREIPEVLKTVLKEGIDEYIPLSKKIRFFRLKISIIC